MPSSKVSTTVRSGSGLPSASAATTSPNGATRALARSHSICPVKRLGEVFSGESPSEIEW